MLCLKPVLNRRYCSLFSDIHRQLESLYCHVLARLMCLKTILSCVRFSANNLSCITTFRSNMIAPYHTRFMSQDIELSEKYIHRPWRLLSY